MKKITTLLVSLICLTVSTFASYDKPTEYVTDKVGILSPATIQSVSSQLAQYQRDTTSQFIVYVANFEGQDALEAVTVKLAHEWQVGQAGKNNGVILFWFPNIHKVRVEVGYGLEGALPDAIAKDIISDTIVPYFKQKQWDQGVQAGVNAIVKTTSKEFLPTHPITESNNYILWWVIGGFLILTTGSLIVGCYIVDRRQRKEKEEEEHKAKTDTHCDNYWDGLVTGAGASVALTSRSTAGVALTSCSTVREEYVAPKERRSDDDNSSSYSYSSPSYGSSSDSSSSSSFDSGFSSGGGDFGGGGASGDY